MRHEAQRVRVVMVKPGGYSKDYWSRFAGEAGTVDTVSPHPKVAFPVLVALDKGGKFWFSDAELEDE